MTGEKDHRTEDKPMAGEGEGDLNCASGVIALTLQVQCRPQRRKREEKKQVNRQTQSETRGINGNVPHPHVTDTSDT